MSPASTHQDLRHHTTTGEVSSLPKSRLRQRFDVFISFRGEDTRKTLTGHLYEALRRRGIVTFKDDKKLEIGDAIDDELGKAIEGSSCSIILLSKIYASSKWCLRELAKIVDCMETMNQLVLPVFYHVLPSDVRTQSGSFKEDFEKHEIVPENSTPEQVEKNAEDVLRWRAAMKNVGKLPGKEVDKDSKESDVLAEIVKWVFDKLRPKAISCKETLVGTDSALHHIDMLMALTLTNEVRFVGIVGMGGIGKTTIAELVHDSHAHKFDSSCFLRVSSDSSNTSLILLQQQLLSELLLTDEFKVWDENYGAEMISTLLRGKRVLLVVDGIEEDWQLAKLANSPSWFGPGSRVIITTRNKRLINYLSKVEMLEYNVPLLDRGDALKLFSKHVTDCVPDQNYTDLSDKVLEYAGGLPLALESLGVASKSESIKKWENIRKVGEKEILKRLRNCYNALELKTQEVFLDIACFFKGKNIKQVVEILESCGRKQVMKHITMLIDRCLMEVSHDKILMHNLIQEMGRDMECGKSLTPPHKRIRIWLREHVNRAFVERQGLRFIEEISLNINERGELHLDAKLFSEMTNLRILEVSQVHLSGNVEYLSNLLGLLNWPGCPSTQLPSTFQSDYLVQLSMPSSRIVQLWEGKKKFAMLKVLDLSNSENFLTTPDVSGVPNLQRLILRGCTKLDKIHPSIICLDQLVFLDLKDCTSLKDFSSNISCKNLKTFILSGCSSLENFPKIKGRMGRLAELFLDGTAIEKLDSSIGLLTGLVMLNLRDCKRLSSLPSAIGNLISLRILNLKGCLKLDHIEPSLRNAKRLEELDISYTSINHAPSTLSFLKKLKILHFEGLSRNIWHSLISSSFDLGSLKSLSLNNCNLEDEDIPKDMCSLSSLEALDLSGNHFVGLSDSLSQLTMLKKLFLNNCHLLQRLPMLPTCLRKVEGRDCILMKDFYNIEVHVPSSEAGVLTLSFPISDQGQNFRIVESLDSRSTQRFIEVIISDREVYDLSCEMDEVLEFFDLIKQGAGIEMLYNLKQTNGHRNTYGIAVSAAIRLKNATVNVGKNISCDFCVNLETAGYPSKSLIDVERNCQLLPGTRVWILYIPFQVLSDRWNRNSCVIKALITNNNPNVVVEKCGASVLSQEVAPVFLGKILSKIHTCQLWNFHQITKYCDPKNSETCLDLAGSDEDYSSNGSIASNDSETFESDSIVSLKRNLKSLLRRMFEEVKHFVPFNFPQRDISRWFKHQQEQPRMRIKLPPDLHKDRKWIGLAIFAVFSVNEINSETAPCFSYTIGSDDQSLMRHSPYLPLPTFLFDDSHQLCIIFEPLVGYLNGRNNLGPLHVSFLAHPEVKIELCGARLVYEQNMDGFVFTIVDSVLRSGEDLHEFFCQGVMETFLGMQKNLQNYDPSPETVSNEKKSVISSVYDNSSVPVENLENGSFSRFPFKSSIQERFDSKFDIVLPGKEIPKTFNYGSEEMKVAIKLPRSLCHDKRNWVGFAVCAELVVDEPTVKLDDNILVSDRSLKLVNLSCQFKIDSDRLEPEHLHFTNENELRRQGAKQFIWLFYLPQDAFKVPWRHCSQFEALVGSNSPLLRVSRCGLQLVHQQDMKEMNKMFKESVSLHSASASGN